MIRGTKLWGLVVALMVVGSLFSGIGLAENASAVSHNQDRSSKIQERYNVLSALFSWTSSTTLHVPEGDRGAAITSGPAEPANLSLSERIDALLEEGKLPFLFFYTDWCGFSKSEKPILEELEKDYADMVEFIWLNVEEYGTEAQKFGVNGYPTMFLITGKGEEGYYYTRIDGYTSREELINKIETTINPRNIHDEQSLYPEIESFLKSGKPVFLFFYTDGCHFCHQQLPIINELENEYKDNISFIRIDITERPDYAGEFGVSSIPTMFIISDKDERGYEMQELAGFTEKERLRDSIYLVTGHESAEVATGTDDKVLIENATADVGAGNVTGPGPVKQLVQVEKPMALASASPIISWEYDQIHPATAYNNQTDEYLVVWEDHHWSWGNDSDIYGRRLDRNGVTLGTYFGISWEGSNHRLAPEVAYNDHEDEFLVVWEYEYTTADHDIYARRVASNGTLIGTEIPLATLTQNESNPDVAYNAIDNEYLIVWEHHEGSGAASDVEIYGQRRAADGTPLGEPVPIGYGFYDQVAPSLAFGSSNREYFVVWQEYGIQLASEERGMSTPLGYDIYGQRIGANGSLVGDLIAISTWEYDQVKPRLAFNAVANEFLVVWEDHHWDWGDDWDIYGQRVNADGTLSGGNIGISWEQPNHRESPDVAYQPAFDEYLVVWEYAYSSADRDVYYRRVGSDGTLWEAELGVSTLGSYERRPAIAADDNRSYLIVWEDGRDAATQGIDLYGNLMELTIFSGYVFVGEIGDESTPLGNVTVELYCSNDAGALGTRVATATTNDEGWYGLPVSGVYEYYNLVETDPAGYTSVGATSISGTVINSNRIQYTYSLASKTLSENKFWDRPSSVIGICNSCSDCTTKLNGDYQVVQLQNNITGGQCINFQANNIVFDCQGFTIEWAGYNPEFSYGIGITGLSGNTIRNCRIANFGDGIAIETSNNNNLINNTLVSNGNGIRLWQSSSNKISNNTITSNYNGVTLVGSSNSNYITNNSLCKQKERDIIALDPTSGNTRSGNRCDKIYNWNNDNDETWCDQVCTANQSTSCSSESEFRSALNGDFNYIKLNNSLTAPGGFVINASHVTINCNNNAIIGNGSSVGLLVDNQLNVSITNCIINNFGTGVSIRSSSKNKIETNNIANNTIGISVDTLGEAKAQDNDIAYNYIGGNSLYGISLVDVRDNRIISNNLERNKFYSIWVSGNCNDSVLYNSGGTGFSPILYQHDIPAGGSIMGGTYSEVIYCNVHHAAIQNITINNSNQKNDGIVIVNSGPIRIEGCTIENSRGIYATHSNNLELRDNIIRNNSNGITTENSASISMYGNDILHNNGSGILLSYTDFANVHSNSIRNNTYGITVSYSNHANISDNTVFFNNDTGVSVESSVGTTVLHNTIRRNRFGLVFDHHTNGSAAKHNDLCYNDAQDIYNSGELNAGVNNTCSKSWWWADSGVPFPNGCENKCIGGYQYYYGYQFHNPSKYPLSFGCPYSACQGDMVDTFGSHQVYLSAKICAGVPLCIPWVGCWCLGYEIDVPTPVPDPNAAIYYAAYYHHCANPGSCTGMSTTSLQFYYNDNYPSRYNSSAQKVSDLQYTGSLENLIDAKHGAITSWEVIKPFLEWLKFYLKGGSNANNVLNQVKQSVDSGNLGSIVMTSESLSAHTVVATDVKDYGDYARIYIYDNNIEEFSTKYPDNEDNYTYIVINKSTNSWYYPKNADFNDEPYAIFFLPYSVANGDLTLPGSQDFLIKGGSLELAGILDFFWGSASSYVEDNTGNKTGRVDGELRLEIPDAVAIPSMGDVNDTNWEFYVLPVGDYIIHIKGKETGKYNTSMFQASCLVLLEDVESNQDTNDTLTLGYENAYFATNTISTVPVISFETSDANKDFSILIGERFLVSETLRLYSIKNTSIAKNSKAIFRPSHDFNSLIYTNKGPSEITYTVELQNSMIAPGVELQDTLPTASRANIVIGPMETHVLTPEDWLKLDGSEVTVHVEKCGDGMCGTGEDFTNCPEDCSADCVVPHDDLHLTVPTTLCRGHYELVDGGSSGVLMIDQDNVVLDCNGAQLFGNGTGIAINSDSTSNITIKNCYIQNFSSGIMLKNVDDANVTQSALIKNGNSGVEIVNGSNSLITQNYITDNRYGIRIYASTDTEITRNLLCPNMDTDITTATSVNNSGVENACDTTSNWNDTGSSGCTFSCTLFASLFDTGPGAYPSIPGTYRGTIMPFHDLNVTGLFTYPAPGTGGHTEYVKIENSTWNAEATWNGYGKDWHNLTFDQPFALNAGRTYNYTIRTGSYPQIIHAPSHNATGGVITCTEFVDVNGKRHEGWIPAIRLY